MNANKNRRIFYSLLSCITGVLAASALVADNCVPVDSGYGYSICLPSRWYHRAMPSGALFLCSTLDRCVTDVGGGPLLGQATLSIIPVEILDLGEVPAGIQEFAHRIADKDTSSQFSKSAEVKGRYANLEYLPVKQVFTSGARNGLPQDVYRYFVRADRRMLELILTFTAGDKRASTYKKAALDIIMNIRTVPTTSGQK
jgi:hypothetical protein